MSEVGQEGTWCRQQTSEKAPEDRESCTAPARLRYPWAGGLAPSPDELLKNLSLTVLFTVNSTEVKGTDNLTGGPHSCHSTSSSCVQNATGSAYLLEGIINN